MEECDSKNLNIKEFQPQLSVKQRKKCSICEKEMDPRSIGRHFRAIHKEDVTPKLICVDRIKGIFMAHKSVADGIAFLIYVRKTNRMEIGKITPSVSVKMTLA